MFVPLLPFYLLTSTLSPGRDQKTRLTKVFSPIDNHKPKQSAERTILTPKSGNSYNLAIKLDGDNEGNEYVYTGTQQASNMCALIYDPASQTFTLDQISADFTFNLRATPTSKDRAALASQYPHLPTGAGAGGESEESESNNSEDLFDENNPSTGADVNNPYDYRHFLKRRRTSSPEPLPSSTPLPVPAASPPRRAPARAKPKARPHHRAPPKSSTAALSPPFQEADADNEASDDGGLTVELDPDVKPRRFRGNFTHDVRDGPISLRSAASSASPAVSVESDEDDAEGEDEDVDVEEFALEEGGGGGGGGGGTFLTVGGGRVEEDQEEDEEDEDEVEEDDDDEGSLEAELEQALESQADEEDGGGVHVYRNGVNGLGVNGLGVNGVRTQVEVSRVVDESSSESEEE